MDDLSVVGGWMTLSPALFISPVIRLSRGLRRRQTIQLMATDWATARERLDRPPSLFEVKPRIVTGGLQHA